jgi:predicted NUDIX family NTP pyrophosphohydrolase
MARIDGGQARVAAGIVIGRAFQRVSARTVSMSTDTGARLDAMTTSAGLVVFREREGALEVLLAHMGGPYWARKDAGAWSIPKGELEDGEDPLAGARREYVEEFGQPPPDGPVIELGEVRQRGGKRVVAFAVEGDFDPAQLRPGTFELEWPPRSGRRQAFPEVDRVVWFDLPTATGKLVRGQVPLLDRLADARRDGS